MENKLSIKDLRIISNRSIKNIVLIDNSPHTYLFQPENAIPILSFFQDSQDQELLKLEKFIQGINLEKEDDVRIKLGKYFKIAQYNKFSNIDQMMNTLFG